MKSLVISTNLNINGKTDVIAKQLIPLFEKTDHDVELIQLGLYNLPICDGYECYQNNDVIKLQKTISEVNSVIICSPVYCYDLNAVAKNLIELTGSAWKDKVVSFVVNAGAEKSYMAPMKFMNSLMIDFRCLIMPKYVYITNKDFDQDNNIHSI